MIKRTLLFPSSKYLETHWWHRLANVIFWAWLLGVIISYFKGVVIDPYTSCIDAKYSVQDGPSDLDCGSNALDYAVTYISAESFSGLVFATVISSIFIFITALLPSLVYRLILYIAIGNSWADSNNEK